MSLINRNEIRRLEKAAKEKDKKHLIEWADSLERQIIQDVRKQCLSFYTDELANSLDTVMVAVAYTLCFSEETTIKPENIADFMTDLFVTIDMYRTGEYRPEEYEDSLKEVGVILDRYDYDKIYKQHLKTMDIDLVKFFRNKTRKIIMICGNPEFKDDILAKYKELSTTGNLVLTNGIFENLVEYDDIGIVVDIQKDKILMADTIYVINKDKKINDVVKKEIEFAKQHNKEIIYLENVE